MHYWSDVNEVATRSKCGAFGHPKKISSNISFKNRTVPVKTGQMETLVKPTTKTWEFKAMQEMIIN